MQFNALPKSLQDDNLFVNELKSNLNHVYNRMLQIDDRMKNLQSETADFHVKLQSIQNNLSALKHKRYVQELIIDENEVSKQSEHPVVDPDAELRASITEAVRQGLQLISDKFKPIAIQIPNQIINPNLVSNDIYEAIDAYLLQDLPPIIGSLDFYSWNVTELSDRPTEINETIIRSVETPPTQTKPQTSKPISVAPVLSDSPPVVEALLTSASQTNVDEPVVSKPNNDFVVQLEQHFNTKKPDTVLKNAEADNKNELQTSTEGGEQINSKTEVSLPQRNQSTLLPKTSASKNYIIQSSSSDEELFVAKPTEFKSMLSKTLTSEPSKVEASKPKVEPKQIKKSLLDDSDDSFDELFKQPPKAATVLIPKSVVVERQHKDIPKTTHAVTNSETVKKPQTLMNPPSDSALAKQITTQFKSKKRSIFDTSSSEDEKEVGKPAAFTPNPLLNLAASSDDEDMPKNVLNSVSNDFSSRLNQALLKKPSPSPSSSVAVKSAKSVPTTTTISSSAPKKREPVERKKQESVAALRGKLGDSIIKAHRISSDGSDAQKNVLRHKSSSSDETTESSKVSDVNADDTNNLIQILKTRPRPPARSAHRPKPAVVTRSEDKEENKPKDEQVLEKSSQKIVQVATSQKLENLKPTTTTNQSTSGGSLANKKKSLFDSDSDSSF